MWRGRMDGGRNIGIFGEVGGKAWLGVILEACHVGTSEWKIWPGQQRDVDTVDLFTLCSKPHPRCH